MTRKLHHVINVRDFDRDMLEQVFAIADDMKMIVRQQKSDIGVGMDVPSVLPGKIMATLFYEPSTRTRLSFEAAMLRLGGSVIGTENATEFSSAIKGETPEDTARVVSGYCDVIVIRHNEEGGSERAMHGSLVPIINAGDGGGQHPTQALLDLYTIRNHFGSIDGLRVAMIGDLAHGRTVRSLAYVLAKQYKNCTIDLISPPQLCMRDDIKKYLCDKDVAWSEADDLDQIISCADVFYQTRTQKERMLDCEYTSADIPAQIERLIITQEKAHRMKPNSIIMHPLPRNVEISREVDQDPRAKYFQQAENGLYVRMALLKMMFVGY